MRTVVRAALQSILHLTSYTDIRRMRFTPNCNTSPGLAGPIESSYEDYSVAKDTEEYVYKVRAVTKIHIERAYHSDEEIRVTRTVRFPSHFCKYFIISFHVTTLKKWHFATM